MKCRSYYPCIRDYAFPVQKLHMLEKCIRGLQESEVVGGWPAVAVGYALEGTIRFRTCPRFPARGDWFLMRRTSCPGVSESAHPSGDVDDGKQNGFANGSGLQGEHMAIRYSVAWPCFWTKPKGPVQLSIIDWGITDRLAEPCCPRMKNTRVRQPHQIPTSDLGN